jgi:hypothetical protein
MAGEPDDLRLMGSSATMVPSRPPVRAPGHSALPGRLTQRTVGLVWGLLVVNVLTYSGSVLYIPSAVGKAITQGALQVALLLALTLNRRVLVRPNLFLCLVSLLVVGGTLTSLEPQHLGTLYRTFRLAEFVATLWLLTPWWGRRDLLLVRCHLAALRVILIIVLLGLLVAPGSAMTGGRLAGVLWGIPPTQVAHYAAVALGLTVVLWLYGQIRGRPALLAMAGAAVILVLTHTRTALVALVAGVVIASLSLIAATSRARKFLVGITVAASVAIITLSSFLTAWLARGEGSQQLSNLTGRTKVWGPLLVFPRDRFQEIFGFGLSNDSFNGLPIDSNWLASYQTLGLFGVVVCAAILVFLLVNSSFQPRGIQRALALFLVTYCLIASFTEVGFTEASMYLLDLCMAASVLAFPAGRQQPGTGPELLVPDIGQPIDTGLTR